VEVNAQRVNELILDPSVAKLHQFEVTFLDRAGPVANA
jgi:hypothetical protein